MIKFSCDLSQLRIQSEHRVDIVDADSSRKASVRRKANARKHNEMFVVFSVVLNEYNGLIVFACDCSFVSTDCCYR